MGTRHRSTVGINLGPSILSISNLRGGLQQQPRSFSTAQPRPFPGSIVSLGSTQGLLMHFTVAVSSRPRGRPQKQQSPMPKCHVFVLKGHFTVGAKARRTWEREVGAAWRREATTGQESGSAAERGVGDMSAGKRDRVDPTEEGMKVPVVERPRKPTMRRQRIIITPPDGIKHSTYYLSGIADLTVYTSW
ncbi:hypothetical protein BRADI_4g09202v3 [Brachypodium distachyon]|uniref:Uncharacterized protein n=1 Tax=Brachypodium distachyon TaxID=15368 RepID=A0A2K2CLH3_BRADI|nr:hypothetical protein BRADI_4g09202v3 [Brachypodium distachyon]